MNSMYTVSKMNHLKNNLMNKLIKLSFLLLLQGVVLLVLPGCEDYSDKLTGSNPEGNAVDVSSRLTGFGSEVTGAESSLTVNGNDLSEVVLVNMGGIWVDEYEATETAVTFVVPASVAIGMNEVVLVFSGNERATSSIEVIPVPTISYFTPKAASDGAEITILGNNLDYVNAVSISGEAATVTDQQNGTLKFTVPSGVSTDVITLTSTSGNVVTSEANVVACTADPSHLACLPVINTNGSFEESDLGEANGVAGWGGLTGSLATGVITDEDAYDGFKSVKITVNDLGANPWSIQPNTAMPVNSNSTYHVSFWIKGSNMANVKFAMDEGGSPGYFEWAAPQVEISASQWTEITYEYSPESEAISGGGDESTRFAISMSYDGNIGGVMYLDNLRVVEVEGGGSGGGCTFEEDPVCFCNENGIDSKCVELANGGFEDGDGDEFINWSKFNGGDLMTATTEGDNVYSGSRALMVTVDGSQGGDEQWRIQLASDATPTEVDANYVVTAWVKAADAGGTIRFSTQPEAQYGPDTEMPTEWTQIQWAFTANVDATQVVLDMGGAFNTTYYLDEVRLIKVQ